MLKMVLCELCLKIKNKYSNIDDSSLGAYVAKYFPLYFETIPTTGKICNDCKSHVEAFHLFHVRVEKSRRTFEKNEFDVCIPSDSLKNAAKSFAPLPKIVNVNCEISNDMIQNKRFKGRKRKHPVNEKKQEQNNIQRQKLNQLERDGNTYLCNNCNSKYVSANEMYRHIKIIHELLPYRCKWASCVESFSSQEKVDAHRTYMHPVTECLYCKKLIADPYMEKHIKMSHDESKKSMCDICGSVYKNKISLKKHMDLHNSEKDIYECDICGSKLKTKQYLRAHLLRHFPDAQKPKICSICDQKFPTSRILHSHKVTKHEDPKFSCNHCEKRFYFKNKLMDHVNSHTGHKGTYICVCNRKYRYASSYYFHRKTCTEIQKSKNNDKNECTKSE